MDRNNKSKLIYKNIYYMVAYCVEELKYFDESLIDYESLSGTHDLLAVLLCKSFEYLYRSGCLRQYNKKVVITDKPRGRINLQKSKQKGLYQQGKLICTITKLNMDTELNQIVKAAFLALISSNKVIEDKIDKKYLTLLNNYRMMLKDVSTVAISEEMLNRNQDIPEQYKPVIIVSKMILRDWIAFDSDGKHRLLELNDDNRLCHIWESYLRAFITKSYSDLKVGKPSYDGGEEIKTDSYGKPIYNDNGDPVYEKRYIQPDIEIKSTESKKIIIGDAKWYTSNTDTNANRNQIRTYSDKCFEKHKKHEKQYKIHGILLYAYDRTDDEPWWKDKSSEHNIECYTYHININQDKADMERDIRMIVEKYI